MLLLPTQPLPRPAVTARPEYNFPPRFYPHHLYALLIIIFIPIKQSMPRPVRPCQPRLSNLTQPLYCFLGHQVDHHVALPANHRYLLILLFLFYLFHLYHCHLSLLHPATQPPNHTFPGLVYVFTRTICLLYTTQSTGWLFFSIPPLCIDCFVSPSVRLSHLVISLTLPISEPAPS